MEYFISFRFFCSQQITRDAVEASETVGIVPAQAGDGSGWSLRCLPTRTVPQFHDSMKLEAALQDVMFPCQWLWGCGALQMSAASFPWVPQPGHNSSSGVNVPLMGTGASAAQTPPQTGIPCLLQIPPTSAVEGASPRALLRCPGANHSWQCGGDRSSARDRFTLSRPESPAQRSSAP